MDIVDTFLNALQDKINASSGLITDFEEKKNQLLEIKNIFYAHNIIKDEIDEKDLISFTSEEINTLFDLLDKEKRELLFKTYSVYKPLVLMYEKIKDKFSGNFEAPQYAEAIKWLKDMAERINLLLRIGGGPNGDYISSLKEDSAYFNKYYKMFNGNELIKPIGDFKEFNILLDKLNFNDEEKYQIKKFVGISNIKLLSSSYTSMDENEFNKYKVILKGKREHYNDLFDALKAKNLEFNNLNIESLVKELNTDEYSLRQALCAVFFEQIFNRVNNKELRVSEAVLELEKILDFSKEVPAPEIVEEPEAVEPKEVQEEQPEVKEDIKEEPPKEVPPTVKENKDIEIIDEARSILRNEKDLINSVDEAEFAQYLAQSLAEESAESIKYQIVSILISLHTELDKYENVKELDHARKMVLINIRDYIDAYKTLKGKLEKIENNK